jgi:hypothetical protein
MQNVEALFERVQWQVAISKWEGGIKVKVVSFWRDWALRKVRCCEAVKGVVVATLFDIKFKKLNLGHLNSPYTG